MDTLYTLVFDGLDGPTICDHVDQATQRGTTTFPYHAPPNRTAAPRRLMGASSAGSHEQEHYPPGHYQQ